MKKIKHVIAPFAGLIAALMVFVACSFEISSNGPLDGMWHLEQIDTLATQGTLDLSGQYYYWSVQNHLLNFQRRQVPYAEYIWRFDQGKETLTIHTPFISARLEGDIPLTDVTIVQPFGANNLAESYQIEKLTKQRMVLKSELLRLVFRKM